MQRVERHIIKNDKTIEVKVIGESYTSKCDALALEPIQKHEEYLGKRIKRGLFQSSTGITINADVNGSLNILRKAIGDADARKLINRGVAYTPVRINSHKYITL